MTTFLNRLGMFAAVLVTTLTIIATRPADAQGTLDLTGKTVTVIVGSTPGGSTDVSARLIAAYLGKHLPGSPSMVVQNRPGARGQTAMNFFANSVAPDGMTIIVGSGSQIDPFNYRVPQSHYDPSTFAIVGGLGIGGSIIMIRNAALARLTDKAASPVVMATIGSIPRSGMQMAAWGIAYLGWNARWVAGYRGNPDLMLAFERGEIDMTSFANATLKPELLDRSKYTILYQSGSDGAMVPSAMKALAGVPLLTTAMKGRISDPLTRQAFDYWRYISSINNWVALPPKAAPGVVATHRAAFARVRADKAFLAQARKMGEDVAALPPESMEAAINEMARLPPQALEHMTSLLASQGLKTPKKKKKKKKAAP